LIFKSLIFAISIVIASMTVYHGPVISIVFSITGGSRTKLHFANWWSKKSM